MRFKIGSGNVYADFGFSNAQEAQTKAELAMLITSIIKERKLTQQQAAQLMGVDQPKVSKVTRGLLSEFTIERLMKFILRLGFAIELVTMPHTAPRIHVSTRRATKGRKLIANDITKLRNAEARGVGTAKAGK